MHGNGAISRDQSGGPGRKARSFRRLPPAANDNQAPGRQRLLRLWRKFGPVFMMLVIAAAYVLYRHQL